MINFEGYRDFILNWSKVVFLIKYSVLGWKGGAERGRGQGGGSRQGGSGKEKVNQKIILLSKLRFWVKKGLIKLLFKGI